MLAQGSELQSQRVSKKLTRTVALQRVQSAQETMICSLLVVMHRIEVRNHPSLLQLKTGTFVALKSAMKSVEHKCQMAFGIKGMQTRHACIKYKRCT